MERALKKLLQIYPITRNWMALSNYMVPLQIVQNASQMYSSNFSGHTQSNDITISLSRKTSYTIKVAPEPMKILDVAATNYTNMSLRDAVNTLSALFDAAKRTKNLKHIESHIGFVHLCEIINRGIRSLKINDVIECLKIFTYFQTQGNTLLVQSLLQMIRANVNEMSIHDIIFLSFLLNKMETTPLRDALLIAMGAVFEIQLPTKFETDNISFLIWSLRFMNNHNIQNQDINDMILKSLWKHKHSWDIQTAKSIFYNLCTISQLSPLGYEMIPNVQNIFISKRNELSVTDITKILEKLKFTFFKQHRSMFYNEVFVNTLVNSALSSNIGYTESINMLNSLNHLDHVHVPFLEHFITKCSENLTLLKYESQKNILSILQGFVNTDYKPVSWDTIREAIVENIERNCRSYNKDHILLIKLTLYLLALDYYSPYLLSEVFSTTIRTNESTKHTYTEGMLLLYQSVKVLYPMYNGPWPQQNLLDYANMIQLNSSPKHSLKQGLEQALGGPQYVHNDLKTKLGHHIDHVVIMRKGGYPIAINLDTSSDRITYVEDLQTPCESQIILIFNFPAKAYVLNSQRLKSTWALKIKSAEMLTKSSAVDINSNAWIKLPEYERIPYLMQAIKLKYEDLLVLSN